MLALLGAIGPLRPKRAGVGNRQKPQKGTAGFQMWLQGASYAAALASRDMATVKEALLALANYPKEDRVTGSRPATQWSSLLPRY
jgi:hypothetical protein